MQTTVTNTSGRTINNLASVEGATGGSREYPLPYPFSMIGELANGASKTLPMGTGDLYVPDTGTLSCSTLQSWQQWQQLVQAGIVTIAFAAETPPSAIDELALTEI